MQEEQNVRLKNWGRTLSFRPGKLYYPSDETELQAIVNTARQEGRVVRVVGTGHSWTGLIETPDILISLDNMQGIEEVDEAAQQATVLGGTKLHKIGEALRVYNLAMENQGDIDKQALAGTLSTGTHGTGIDLGIIATQAVMIRLVNGRGEIEELTPDDGERFRAAQVSLGALGIITKIRLQLVSAYNLELVKAKEHLDQALNRLEHYRDNNRNYEFFWFPYADTLQHKFMNQTRKPSQHSPVKKYLTDVVWENGTFKLLCEFVRLFPAASKRANLIAADGMADGKEILPSHKLYPTERLVRFYEMEYALPAEHGPAVIRQIRDTVRRQQLAVCFPIEYRYGRGDDILLSPAQGRDTVFISVHMYMGMDYKSYFDALEPIFLRYEGRPHWGKMHTQDAGYLRQAYPHWDTFLAIRQAMDPDGIFLNTYLRQLLGVEAPVEAASAEH